MFAKNNEQEKPMEQNSTASAERRASAVAFISDIFTEIVCSEGRGMLESEDMCIDAAHSVMAEALGIALERYDDQVCSSLDDGVRVHDRRVRTLATKLGDVTFRYRRCRDAAGSSVIPLADALDLPWGSRISPSARDFLVEAGAEVSFAKSARLLRRAGGSQVSATCVMSAVRRIGQLCAEEDELAASSLYEDGIVPDGGAVSADLCIEADGTWIRLQRVPEGEPDKVEVKALVSYSGKERRGAKAHRVNPVRHGCVGTSGQFWRQGVAAVASRYDISKVERVHLGCDGEHGYKEGSAYFPLSVECDAHLDPFHVNRAILACFPASERRLASNVVGMAIDGDAAAAAEVIEIAAEHGLANANAARVAGYLRNNEQIIYSGGPSLGTMESEQQHVYGCRMDSVPCAWSVPGVDAMARLRSRRCSGRDLPRLTRSRSVTPRRERRSSEREIAYLSTKIDTRVPKTVGKGYEAEHSASLSKFSAEVRYAAGIDSGMVATGW